MLSNDLIRLIKPIIEQKLSDFYTVDARFKKGFQRRKVGADSEQVVYYHQLESKNYGLPGRNSFYDSETSTMRYQEEQVIETTFQINSLVPKTSTITASDLLMYVRAIFTHIDFITTLTDNRVAIFKPTSIRSGWFETDTAGYENNPSFDVTFQHILVTDTTTNSIDNFEDNIKRV